MRHILIIIVSLLLTLVYSCDPCKNLDCVASDFYGEFRIVSATTGQDLLFGPHNLRNDLKICGATRTRDLERFGGI